MARSVIEAHPQRELIDQHVRAGKSTRTIANIFGLHQTSVVRYAKKLKAADEARRAENDAKMRSPDFVVEQLRILYAAATASIRRASDVKSTASQVQAQKEARATLKEIERLLDKQRAQGAATTGVPAHLVQAALIDALKPYPKARDAVVAALVKLEAEHGAG